MSISGKTPATSLTGSITLTTKKTAFIQFDIKEFFPSITEEIVGETISFALQSYSFKDHKIRTTKLYRKSLWFHPQQLSIEEKNGNKLF